MFRAQVKLMIYNDKYQGAIECKEGYGFIADTGRSLMLDNFDDLKVESGDVITMVIRPESDRSVPAINLD